MVGPSEARYVVAFSAPWRNARKLIILVGTGPVGLYSYRATANCVARGDIRGPVVSYWYLAEARAG